jgi:hypothetical protein
MRSTLPRSAAFAFALGAALALPAYAAAQTPIVLDAPIPDGTPRYFAVPFTVPEGIREIEVRHDDLSAMNILDWGLADPSRFRGWGGGNAIASHVAEDASKQAAALEYVNWWNTAGPAGNMGLQGYYNAVIDATAQGLGVGSPEDAFWLQGEPASKTLNDPFGQPTIKKGTVRDGGSYSDRCGDFNTWNSHMDEADYVAQKWQEFKSA